MIRITSIRLQPDCSLSDLNLAAAKYTGIDPSEITDLRIIRKSIEARRKEPLSLVYSVLISAADEKKILRFLNTKKGRSFAERHGCTFVEKEEEYRFPCTAKNGVSRPLIVGSGPAGMLCAYELAANGFAPLVIERGLPIDQRIQSVENYWENGRLDPECNVQFGEGGAGTFSDGKLNSGISDKASRIKEVFRLFIECGAPESVAYDSLPHIGSDILYRMIPAVRKKITDLGGEYRFGCRLDDIIVENNSVTGALLSDGSVFHTDTIVYAGGHSARDTIRMLHRRGVEMSAKNFAVGVRCEHDQEMINQNQWGADYPKELGAAPYKLSCKTQGGRSVYSFCMCPGGYVVDASSVMKGIAVNGMSLSARDSGKANSAIVVSVTPEDYKGSAKADTPEELSGMDFQNELEQKAYVAGQGHIPVQYYDDFKENRISDPFIEKEGRHCGKTVSGNIREVLPEVISESIIEGMECFSDRIRGFNADKTLLYAVESRTSSPVRIVRDDSFQSSIRGLYPCGEGAGYAGGIMSAAVDGIKTAEAVALNQILC